MTQLKMREFHISIHNDMPPYISADIEVHGLGKVNIRDCLSVDTVKQISEEVCFVLRQKMGIPQ